jgi:drug/metabolite transporter (DMT)-like permease
MSDSSHRHMTRRGWVLFAAMSVIWGVPYLLIKVAVDELAPPVVVAGRTSLAALVLLPIAAYRGALRPALARWRPLLAFTTLEMAIPWLLLTDAERRLPSGLTGLLIAAVPLVGTVTAYLLGDRTALRPVRLAGLATGLTGVALLVGLEIGSGTATVWPVLEVLLVCVGYATAPFIATRRLADVPSFGVIAVSLTIVAVVYLPLAALTAPSRPPSGDAVLAVLGLAALCTAVAFVVFFALLAEVGPDRATLITFLNPAVAAVAGFVVLDEAITVGMMLGFPLVLAGCWLATRTASPPAVVPADPGDLTALNRTRT